MKFGSLIRRLSKRQIIVGICLIVFAICLGSIVLLYQGRAVSPQSTLPEASSSAIQWSMSIFTRLMLIVIGLMGLLFLVKHWQPHLGAGARKQMCILETTRLSQRQSLHIIRVGSDLLLIGATDQQINLIARLDCSQFNYAETGEPGLDFSSLIHAAHAKINPSDDLCAQAAPEIGGLG